MRIIHMFELPPPSSIFKTQFHLTFKRTQNLTITIDDRRLLSWSVRSIALCVVSSSPLRLDDTRETWHQNPSCQAVFIEKNAVLNCQSGESEGSPKYQTQHEACYLSKHLWDYGSFGGIAHHQCQQVRIIDPLHPTLN